MAPFDLMGTRARRQDEWRQANAGEAVTTYRVISDHLGSPMMAVNVNNASDVPFAAEYTAFGERTVTSDVMSEDWLPFGFAGGLYDADTGLVRLGARDYDAVTGRWTAKDPIRWNGRQTNLYLYVGGDPVDGIDPDGTFVMPAVAVICAMAAIATVYTGVVIWANSESGQKEIGKTKDWFSKPTSTDQCYPQYLEDTAYCGETYPDDHRYTTCMDNAWKRYIRCLNGLGPDGPLVPW